MYLKSDFKAIVLNLQQMGKVIRVFHCHKTFVPNVFSASAWGYIHVIKHIKMVKNQTSKRFFFKLATNGQSDKEFSVDVKILSPRGCLSLP